MATKFLVGPGDLVRWALASPSKESEATDVDLILLVGKNDSGNMQQVQELSAQEIAEKVRSIRETPVPVEVGFIGWAPNSLVWELSYQIGHHSMNPHSKDLIEAAELLQKAIARLPKLIVEVVYMDEETNKLMYYPWPILNKPKG